MGKKITKNMIFIIGSGRSGTHWLGNILGGHKKVRITVEKPDIFNLVTKMAVDPLTRPQLMPRLIQCYNVELTKTKVDFYADKSHPNIWLAEGLANIYLNSIFIGIRRNPYSTIASMLLHKGVLKWQKNWNQYPHPNEFLGTNLIDANLYKNLSASEKAAYRWLSHSKKLDLLKISLGNRITIVNYEDLITNSKKELSKLENFIGLKEIPLITPQKESLEKWRDQLNMESCNNIRKITGVDYSEL